LNRKTAQYLFREDSLPRSHFPCKTCSSTRYPPLMRRNAAVQDSAEESFAGLLEHLTRHSRSEASASQSDADFAPRTSSTASPHSLSRSATRALLPVAEVKTGRRAAMPESAPLSYEKALRLHARRQPGVNGNLDLPAAPPPSVPSQPGALPAACPETRKPAKPGETSARAEGGANSTSGKPGILKAPAKAASRSRQPATQAGTRPGAKFATRSSSQSPTKAPSSKPAGQHPADSQTSTYASSSFSARKRSSAAISGPRRKPKPCKPAVDTLQPDSAGVLSHAAPSGAAFEAAARESILPSGDDRSLITVERHDLQWSPTGPLQSAGIVGPLDQINQMDRMDRRQSIVSLRLTDVELLSLKDRASESGISVSAYMRSCILDADQLRAQVKQALAEMRALSTRPDPSRFPALAVSNDSAAGVDWLRLLMRSAAFLLSPLFPFRRGA